MKSLVVLILSLTFLGCGGGKLPSAEHQHETPALPPGHPPMTQDGGAAPAEPAVAAADNVLAFMLEGQNGVKELAAGRARAGSPELADRFEEGYRLTFTEARAKRDYAAAAAILDEVVAAAPDFPHAYRALGYARFNLGFDVDAAMENYTKAVALDDQYGEAHYALAFLYVPSDLKNGEGHFRIAMDLGVPDERQLGERFYNKSQ